MKNRLFAALVFLLMLIVLPAHGESMSSRSATVEYFDDLSVKVESSDLFQRGNKKEGETLFVLYPDYDESALYRENINASWMGDTLAPDSDEMANLMGSIVLEEMVDQLERLGAAVPEYRLIETDYDEATGKTTIAMMMMLDFSDSGTELIFPMHQLLYFVPVDDGIYLLTMTSDSETGMYELFSYMKRVVLFNGEPEPAPEGPEAYANVLSADLTVIEAEAFQGAQFTDCYLPDGVTDIGAAAFRNCAELVYVRIPATVTTIAADAFEGCTKLVIVAPEGSQAEVYATAGGIRFIAE